MGIKEALKGKVLLAPMAGVTDSSFRSICKEMGAYLTYTEMISAKALSFNNIRTKELLFTLKNERPVAVQLFGNEPQLMADMAKQVIDEYCDDIKLIDINMGCPAPKITNNNEGSALMKDPILASEIISAVKKNIDIPLTVKFRKGFDEQNVNAVTFAKMCEDSGADAICVHGRTRNQFYFGKADWDIISKVKQNVNIAVIGNGDIFSAKNAKDMFEYTKVDAVMVARGCLGNPFLFKQIDELLNNGEVNYNPSTIERMDVLLKQAKLTIEQKGERLAIKQLRKHASWYTKGMKGAARVREMLVRVNNFDELKEITEKIKQYK